MKQFNRRNFLKIASLSVSAIALPSLAAPGKKKPNIILVFTDDQGWADTSVEMMKGMEDSRSDFYQTPNLERMAKKGMVFSNAYSPAPTCTPSRTSP